MASAPTLTPLPDTARAVSTVTWQPKPGDSTGPGAVPRGQSHGPFRDSIWTAYFRLDQTTPRSEAR
jgi:hypothetical protein